MTKVNPKKKVGLHFIQNKKGEWYATFISKNGKEVWRTSETYHHYSGVVKSLNTLLIYAPICGLHKHTKDGKVLFIERK